MDSRMFGSKKNDDEAKNQSTCVVVDSSTEKEKGLESNPFPTMPSEMKKVGYHLKCKIDGNRTFFIKTWFFMKKGSIRRFQKICKSKINFSLLRNLFDKVFLSWIISNVNKIIERICEKIHPVIIVSGSALAIWFPISTKQNLEAYKAILWS